MAAPRLLTCPREKQLTRLSVVRELIEILTTLQYHGNTSEPNCDCSPDLEPDHKVVVRKIKKKTTWEKGVGQELQVAKDKSEIAGLEVTSQASNHKGSRKSNDRPPSFAWKASGFSRSFPLTS
ncbi:hypothetical protein RRG08_031837 [Elysia crispata]|uniref:Uncharacterized protein n=1 Tax=Elysia crispata TaxID=231223 RepID=A0AAE0Y7A2_9GAST|nr:hypothetical protein RRG08_031837 [Elysia crispata]